ncbi:MAG: cysteine hydrolase [Deltaproteobacteria bacterium]|nr:cysteine hydrolase [Deltaproteobacteria bacterium]
MLDLAGKKIPNTLEEIISPGRTALLVWDMEYAIAPNAFNFGEIRKNLKTLTALARSIGVPVFYSVQVPFDLQKEEAGVWVRVRMQRAKITDISQLLNEKEDPHGRDIINELKPEPQDIVFRKRRPDGFVGTDFDLMLRSRGIQAVLIGGVATEGGVEGTARTGRNLGYDMVVLKDCVGSRNRDLHELALTLMERTQFDLATSTQVGNIWQP